MPSERFYLNSPLKNTVELTGTEFHHLSHVMRIRAGEEIELVNGKGDLALGKVKEMGRHSALVEILSLEHTPLLPPRINLAVALMRPSKLELVIEKCVELGADAFYLYPAHFSEKTDLSDNQKQRLEYIAISAMKQCGRLDLPPIHVLSHFKDLFSIPYPLLFGDTRPKAKRIESQKEALFVTGPEKGFSEEEHKLLEKKGLGVKLHTHILRAETAPVSATCLLSYLIKY